MTEQESIFKEFIKLVRKTQKESEWGIINEFKDIVDEQILLLGGEGFNINSEIIIKYEHEFMNILAKLEQNWIDKWREFITEEVIGENYIA